MLPFSQKLAFLLFALACVAAGAHGFYRIYRQVRRGSGDTEPHFDQLLQRLWHASATTLTQSRTFRKRPVVSFFHSFIFYGFVFYLLVNLVDGVEGYLPISIASSTWPGAVYNLAADLLSVLVLVGVVALVFRRFLPPGRKDFFFNERTLLHRDVQRGAIRRDSLIVSMFILFHVGSRAVGAAARVAAEGPDRFQPFATVLAHAIDPRHAQAWRLFGYWGALGSVLAFLAYFPFSKHLHLFMAPLNYLAVRRASSGVLPPVELNLESEDLKAGADRLEDLAWPRLLDAYACIQCNRCQDVCPATATGKALSPSALEINKRMELNTLAKQPDFARGEASPRPLLSFALTPEAAWACTTCGACVQVCPVQDEPMLDIIDIRRNQVMMLGEFPNQLQAAFRGMERASNPWGIAHEKRMEWAEGLKVKTVAENPDPDVLYWVGCAASYDPQSQKTARAFVSLLNHADVNFSVLGKQECCTGDSARRAGNEVLYQQLAGQNVATLQAVKPKLIVATCPHCMNAIGKEYRQLGGEFEVLHHTEYLERLVQQGRLQADPASSAVTFHDPCYLGRHNGVYDAPRNVLRVLSNDVRELARHGENSFCCGAGGGQFWKEEEPGRERISDNRFREAQQALAGSEEKVLAVGCPFCKSMLESTPAKGSAEPVAVKDVAELLLEGVLKKLGQPAVIAPGETTQETSAMQPDAALSAKVAAKEPAAIQIAPAGEPVVPIAGGERKKWVPTKVSQTVTEMESETTAPDTAPLATTKPAPPEPVVDTRPAVEPAVKRKAWVPKAPGGQAPQKPDNETEQAK